MSLDPTEHQIRTAIGDGADALKHMRIALERAAEELARYEQRYETAESLRDKANVINWAIGYAAGSPGSNLRIDLAASAQAKLHAIARETPSV
jgi:hypothetical protein